MWSKVVRTGRFFFSLKCPYLHLESSVLDGNGVMAAEEQSEESKHQQ